MIAGAICGYVCGEGMQQQTVGAMSIETAWVVQGVIVWLTTVLTAKAAARADAHMNDMIAYLKELDPADPIRVAWDTATDGEKRRPAGRSNVSGRLSVRKHPWQQ